MKTILVATDFSPVAANALRYGADLSSFLGGRLVLIHVVHIPVSYSEVGVGADLDALQKDAESRMEEVRRSLPASLSIQTVVRIGDFVEELLAECTEKLPYAVLVGSQGSSTADRFLFGGHTLPAIKLLHYPVLTIPPKAQFYGFKKIALACDLHEGITEPVLLQIRTWAQDFRSALHILNAEKVRTYNPEQTFESGLLEEKLSEFHPECHFIGSEKTDQALLDYAQQQKMDLLIVLPHKHNLWQRLTSRSHSSTLVLHSQLPVLALHA